MSPLTPGQCNYYKQMLVEGAGKADASDDASICVLRCMLCGHEYVSKYGGVDVRRCPICQDGPPGLAWMGSGR